MQLRLSLARKDRRHLRGCGAKGHHRTLCHRWRHHHGVDIVQTKIHGHQVDHVNPHAGRHSGFQQIEGVNAQPVEPTRQGEGQVEVRVFGLQTRQNPGSSGRARGVLQLHTLHIKIQPPHAGIHHQLVQQVVQGVIIRTGDLGISAVRTAERDDEPAAGCHKIARIRQLVEQVNLEGAVTRRDGKRQRGALQAGRLLSLCQGAATPGLEIRRHVKSAGRLAQTKHQGALEDSGDRVEVGTFESDAREHGNFP